MDGTMNWDTEGGKEQAQSTDGNPVSWIETEELDALLWNAVAEESSRTGDEDREDFEEIDEYLADDDDFDDEAEQRRCTLRLLTTFRPHLAELLGGPPAE